ncbi:MAG: hypothetical protein J7M39_02595, partial [Anaerolineae bacterium]|nr:hypothetical protein [Anaerolineae bacterium]
MSVTLLGVGEVRCRGARVPARAVLNALGLAR